MKNVRIISRTELKLDGIAVAAKELDHSLVFLKVPEEEIDEVGQALADAEVIADLENTSFVLTSRDIKITIVSRDGPLIVKAMESADDKPVSAQGPMAYPNPSS